jgi:hypothetical protein
MVTLSGAVPAECSSAGIASARLEAFAIRVRMCIEESRLHRVTVQANQSRRGSGVPEKRCIVADGRNPSGANRDRGMRELRSSVMTLPRCRMVRRKLRYQYGSTVGRSTDAELRLSTAGSDQLAVAAFVRDEVKKWAKQVEIPGAKLD